MTDGVTRCVSSLGGSPQRLCTSAPPRDYESYEYGRDNQVNVRQRILARAETRRRVAGIREGSANAYVMIQL